MSECGCYHGLDCTKISVCASETAIEELKSQLAEMYDINMRNINLYLDAETRLAEIAELADRMKSNIVGTEKVRMMIEELQSILEKGDG